MTVTLYGIPNCDTVKKARIWLDSKGIAYVFHDFKKAGAPAALIDGWLTQVPWTTLLNTRGTTWRGLPETRRAEVSDAAGASSLMQEAPSLIKRPVLATGGAIHVGFSDAAYQDIFKPS
ncbi:arsenate reductase [Noviherbaspirillum humi]|uniref:Arsenate reductase n=1 Tax=Noviherbaspirillum humi TaxID=1688639 RepID=A0A239H5P4_9BURK|nr:ArsC family reductase [Noviherbaspirillum humi]SNS76465.1 arsenate reductase [Noviherbaspirillum humi]